MGSVCIQPTQGLRGTVTIPGDKSITHRAIILASLSNAQVVLKNWLDAADCWATISAMRQLGVLITAKADGLHIKGVGLSGLKAAKQPIDCGNSGTTMRLLTGLLAVQAFDSVLIGDASLSKRPMARIAEPLNSLGAKIECTDSKFAPIRIYGRPRLNWRDISLSLASAQVQTALQLASLYADKPIHITTPLPCRDHTEKVLKFFKPVLFEHSQEQIEYRVVGDFSAASFFIVAGLIVADSKIILKNIGVNPTRIGLLHVLKNMNANLQLTNQQLLQGEPCADITVTTSSLSGTQVNAAKSPLMIDEFPILSVAAACANGKTSCEGVCELRVKESDRIEMIEQNMHALGIKMASRHDDFTIVGGHIKGGKVSSGGDHRIAMAMMIAGLVAQQPIEVDGCQSVEVSFPSFIETLRQLTAQCAIVG